MDGRGAEARAVIEGDVAEHDHGDQAESVPALDEPAGDIHLGKQNAYMAHLPCAELGEDEPQLDSERKKGQCRNSHPKPHSGAVVPVQLHECYLQGFGIKLTGMRNDFIAK